MYYVLSNQIFEVFFMSALITAYQLGKSYGPKQLFSELQFSINEKDRLALVGENGAGKTTLLQLLLGQETLDSGKVIQKKGLTIGYLSQVLEVHDSVTVQEYLEGDLRQIKARMDALESKLTDEGCLQEYGQLQEAYDQRGGWDFDSKMERILTGLQLDKVDLQRAIKTMSLGERARLALASLLLKEPDLLILDEPTNHLDEEGLVWLENFLNEYSKAFLVVSHDREFLDRSVSAIVELRKGKTFRYTGCYSDYLVEKEKERLREEKRFFDYQEEIRQLKRAIKSLSFSKKAPGKLKDNNKMAYDRAGELFEQSEARSLNVLNGKLENLQNNEVVRPPLKGTSFFRFTQVCLNSQVALTMDGIEYEKGSRLGIKGPNGSGKTTFLKKLYNEAKRAPSVKVAFMTQDDQMCKFQKNIMDHFEDIGSARKLFAKLKLPFDLKIDFLSLGEKQKLKLAILLCSKANVLLLDEPTNHLDLQTLEALEKALLAFEGVIIAVSHDRRFLSNMENIKNVT